MTSLKAFMLTFYQGYLKKKKKKKEHFFFTVETTACERAGGFSTSSSPCMVRRSVPPLQVPEFIRTKDPLGQGWGAAINTGPSSVYIAQMPRGEASSVSSLLPSPLPRQLSSTVPFQAFLFSPPSQQITPLRQDHYTHASPLSQIIW